MRAITIPAPGGPEALVHAEVPDPEAGPDEVLVAVAAAGVNRADLLQRAGHYPPPAGASPLPGLEVSGTVVAVGPTAGHAASGAGHGGGPGGRGPWRVGDRVAALLSGGGYAERVRVPVGQLMPVPDALDLVDAAALPEAVCTAWTNLVADPQDAGTPAPAPGSWLLVHGGSGGVGSMAIQIGRVLGLRVVATAGGPDRVARCLELGAEVGIDHRREDFVEVVREVTAGHGADVVLDVVGAAYLDRNLRALATGGRLVVIGLQKGRRGELDLGLLLSRRATVRGSLLRARSTAEKAALVAEVRRTVWPWVADGRVVPVVHERLPLAQAGRAHELLEAGGVFGKLLLVP